MATGAKQSDKSVEDLDGRAARVMFDEDDQTFAIFSARVFDAQFLESQHGQADAEHLAGAEMAVGGFGFAEIIVERKHLNLLVHSCSHVVGHLGDRLLGELPVALYSLLQYFGSQRSDSAPPRTFLCRCHR